jgi:P-type Ca2+ transporter type 2C
MDLNTEQDWYLQSEDEIFQNLQSNIDGLTSEEAKKRLFQVGLNRITHSKDPSLWIVFLRQFLTPFVVILAVAVAVKIFTQDVLDAVVLISTVFLMVFIGFFQEMKAERAVKALKKLSAHKCKVLRDQQLQVIASEMLVPGDIIRLETGDTVPADARILEAINLKVNEATLTGESQPVEKNTIRLDEKLPLAERMNMLFTGTVVVYGKVTAVVTNTAMSSCLGKIATTLQEIKLPLTPLQKNIRAIGRWMLIIIFIAVFIFAWISIYRGISLIDVLLLSVAAIISAIPEGLPVAFTATFAAGMRSMAKRNAIIRKLAAVETLGATTVICSDKTGTLTLNQMTVSKYFTHDGLSDDCNRENPVCQKMMEIGVLCNDAQINPKGMIGDPTEVALLHVADLFGLNREALHQSHPRLHEIPFMSENLYMATLVDDEAKRWINVKGAPEKVLSFSNSILTTEGPFPIDKSAVLSAIHEMTSKALRLIAVAYLEVDLNRQEIKEEDFRGNLIFVGIFGMIDPPRKEVISAIQSCYEAGIRVLMITGDNPQTAMAIAKQLNIQTEGAIVGKDLENLSSHDLRKKMDHVSVFARVEPSHKLRLVQSLQREGHIVAMTGDGVNDAPALEAADIGISMGVHGTDVAKEASDMILADDRFDSIVVAIAEGRAIFNRLRNVCTFFIATCFGELLGLILCVLFLGIAPLLPLQILWINLVSGSVIAIPLGLEPRVGSEMQQPPRDPRSQLIYPGMMYRLIFLAGLLGIGTFCVFYFSQELMSVEKARTMALCSIIVFEWLIGFEIRSDNMPLRKVGFFKNKPLLAAISITFCMHLMILYIPIFQRLFGLKPLDLMDWAIAIIPGIVIFILENIRKEFFPNLFSSGKWEPML